MPTPDAHTAGEVLEVDASPVIQAVYSDIRSSLRAPIVNLVFRVLAGYPDFLQLAWRQLRANVQIIYFERRADAIRARAVEGMAEFGIQDFGPESAETREILRVFHYVNPKLLMVVAVLRAATGGQYPRLESLPEEEKRQILCGIPPEASGISIGDPATAPPHLKDPFDDTISALGISAVNSDYRFLAADPGYLQTARNALKPLIERSEYWDLQRDLRLLAEEAILNLPFRVETNPHVMRLCGMSENEVDEVRDILEQYYRLLPGLIANISFLNAGAFGKEAAIQSPFPVTVL